MYEIHSARWRWRTFDPADENTSWVELHELMDPESILRNTLERVCRAGVPVLLAAPPCRGKRWIARAAHALAGRRGPLLEAERIEAPGGRGDLAELWGRAAGGSLALAGLPGSPDRSQRELADLLDEPHSTGLFVLIDQPAETAMEAGLLRRDLGDRLFWLDVLALRDRPADITAGLRVFLRKEAARCGRPEPEIHDLAHARLQSYEWPGDLAELERFAQRAVTLGTFEEAFTMWGPGRDLVSDPGELWDAACRRIQEGRTVSLDRTRRRLVRQAERSWVARVLDRVGGDADRAAELLGVSAEHLTGADAGRRR